MVFVKKPKTATKTTSQSIKAPLVIKPVQVNPALKSQQAERGIRQFLSKSTYSQHQAAQPVLMALNLHGQETSGVEGRLPALQKQVSELSAALSPTAIQEAVQRQQERNAPTPIIRQPQSHADWVTVMRQQAEQAEGRSMQTREAMQFTALQRQIAQRLTTGYRQDRQPSATRNAEYAQHLVQLQRHPISSNVAQVILNGIPGAERPALQRAVDEVLQREADQQARDTDALTLHSLQRQLADLNEQATQPVWSRIQARRGAGNPLPEAVQRHLEQGLNHDLSAVRIHDDAEADKLAKGVNAIAFTTGTDIFFQSGKFNPNTQSGLELLAHEVTHTVQQSKGQVGKGIDPSASHETEAQTMGRKIARKPVNWSTKAVKLPGQAKPLLPKSAVQRQALQRSIWGADWWQQFINKGAEQALELAARVPNGAAIVAAFKNSRAVFQKIIGNPSGFFKNLTGAVVNGFTQFKTHIGTHLQGALVDWLAGTSIAGTGRIIAFPKSLDAKAILGFGMDVFGLNYDNLIRRLGTRYGAEKVRKAEGQFALLKQAKTGLHQLNDFRHLDQQARTGVMSAAKDYAIKSVAQQAVIWVSGFITSGGLIPVAKTAFNLISTILQNASTFQSLGQAILGSISDIANGNTSSATQKVEQNLVRVMGLVLKFLSKMLGLDKISGAIKKGIAAIQKPVDNIIGKIVNSKPVQAFFSKFTGSTAKGKAGTAPTNDLRSSAEKKRDLDKAIAAGTELLKQKKFTPDELDDRLDALKKQYQLAVLKVIEKKVAPLQVERRIHGEVNPVSTGPAVVFTLPETWQGTRKNPINVIWPKPATARYPTIYLGGAKANRPTYSNTDLEALVGQPDPDVPGAIVKKYKPHQLSNLSSGSLIGISGKYQVYKGKILKFDASLSTKTKGGDTFNDVASLHGLGIRKSKFNADHILERQLGGADELQNLWPLNRSLNGSGGSLLHYMKLDLGGGVMAKMTDMKNTSRKFFLRVVDTK